MPFTIRGMLRIILDKTRHKGQQKRFSRNQTNLMSELLFGCWLNAGFRDPCALGLPFPDDRHMWFSFTYFQSCRLILEHCASFKRLPTCLPDGSQHPLFDIARINDFIEKMAGYMYVFYDKVTCLRLP